MKSDPNRSIPLHATVAVIQAARLYIQDRHPKHFLADCLQEIFHDLEHEHAESRADDET